MIENPIIRGFNPDPSIIRVKDTYYIATSTFEWWPGVAVYSSKDLKNWRLDHYPLNRISQLNLQGVPDGGGIWAPCLSYDGNEAFLVYTNVKERGPFRTTLHRANGQSLFILIRSVLTHHCFMMMTAKNGC